MTKLFTYIRFVAAILTLLAIAGKSMIPVKERLILPNPKTQLSLYGPQNDGGESSVSWISKPDVFWRCEVGSNIQNNNCGIALALNQTIQAAKNIPFCSESVIDADNDGWGWENGKTCRVTNGTDKSLNTPFQRDECSDRSDTATQSQSDEKCTTPPEEQNIVKLQSLDISHYDHLSVRIHYEGMAHYLRIYAINANPLYKTGNSPENGKFMTVLVNTDLLRGGQVNIPLSDFQVEEWWALKHNPSREEMQIEFDHIIAMGVDHTEDGIHRMRVDEVKLVGKNISDELFLGIIAAIWLLYAVSEVTIRYFMYQKIVLKSRAKILALSQDSKDLQLKQHQLRGLKNTNRKTGYLNPVGLADQLAHLGLSRQLPKNSVIYLIEIDGLEALGDEMGRQVRDSVIKTIADELNKALTEQEIFAHWEGDEFVVLRLSSENTPPHDRAENFHQTVSQQLESSEHGHLMAVTIGVAQRDYSCNFQQLYHMASQALSHTNHPRGSVVYDIDG